MTPAKRKHREFDGLGFIGRSGLPNAKDVSWIRDLLGGRRLVFLGDMEPVDLMAFALWRASLEPGQVAYFGISDHYLQRLEIEIPQNYTIALSPCEQRAMPVLEAACPKYRALVGPDCAALLDGGRKIELEAVATRLGPPGRLLLPLVTPRG